MDAALPPVLPEQVEDVLVTRHALLRYRCHHPVATAKELVTALHTSIELEVEMASALTGRVLSRRVSGVYHLAPDRQGLFVSREGEPRSVGLRAIVITYLRFELSQQRFARYHWPVAEPPAPPIPIQRPEPVSPPAAPPAPQPVSLGQLEASHPVFGVPTIYLHLRPGFRARFPTARSGRTALLEPRDVQFDAETWRIDFRCLGPSGELSCFCEWGEGRRIIGLVGVDDTSS